VLLGQLQVGERLPNERDLGRLFGVSRSTLREAIRILEAEGIVEVRRGTTGGTFVARPKPSRVGFLLAALIRFHEATPSDFAEFRLTFEAETAYLAAKRATPEDVARLLAIAEKARRVAEDLEQPWENFIDLDISFHEELAAASKNPIRVAIMLGVHEAFRQSSLSLGTRGTREWRISQAEGLMAIARAIKAKKPRIAKKLMREHVLQNRKLAAEILTS
jgi:GntR family transcriptional repressor for pyruvate dehydrogenase complex